LLTVFVASVGFFVDITGVPVGQAVYRVVIHPVRDWLRGTQHVTMSNAPTIIYRMVERQIQLNPGCREGLHEPEWAEFLTWARKLDFAERLPSPHKEDLAAYRDRFVRLLEASPSPDRPTAEFDCGFAQGELLLLLRPVLVDYQINVDRARRDGRHPGILSGLSEFVDFMKLHYYAFLGVDPARLSDVEPDARSFFEYSLIWMVLYIDESRTDTAVRAQGAFLALSKEGLEDLRYKDRFVSIHNNLDRMSAAVTDGDKVAIRVHGARILSTLTTLSDRAISEAEASDLGGDRFVKIVSAMRDFERGDKTLEDMLEILRSIKP
jgi:hypothetical protein